MKKNIIKYIILIIIIIIINITNFFSVKGKSYCNNYNSKMFYLEKERNLNQKSIMNNSIEKKIDNVKKKPIMNNHHIKKKDVSQIKISLKKRIYNFFYKRKNYTLIKKFFLKKTKFIIINHPSISEAEYLFKKKIIKKL